MKYYYVYIHICLATGKSYIGWSASPKRRWIEHCAVKDNTYFHNSIRKYGRECFERHILFRTTNLDEVKQKEIEFIKQLDTRWPNGYNLTSGGDGVSGRKHTEKWKKNKSKQMKGNKHLEGYHHTKEAIEKNRQAHIGKKRPDVVKRMQGKKIHQGCKHTKESKNKIRKSMLGKNLKNGKYTKEAQIKRLKMKIEKLEKEN